MDRTLVSTRRLRSIQYGTKTRGTKFTFTTEYIDLRAHLERVGRGRGYDIELPLPGQWTVQKPALTFPETFPKIRAVVAR